MIFTQKVTSIHTSLGKLVPKSAAQFLTSCKLFIGCSTGKGHNSQLQRGFKSKCWAIKEPLENYWHGICATAHQYTKKGEEFANIIELCSDSSPSPFKEALNSSWWNEEILGLLIVFKGLRNVVWGIGLLLLKVCVLRLSEFLNTGFRFFQSPIT